MVVMIPFYWMRCAVSFICHKARFRHSVCPCRIRILQHCNVAVPRRFRCDGPRVCCSNVVVNLNLEHPQHAAAKAVGTRLGCILRSAVALQSCLMKLCSPRAASCSFGIELNAQVKRLDFICFQTACFHGCQCWNSRGSDSTDHQAVGSTRFCSAYQVMWR